MPYKPPGSISLKDHVSVQSRIGLMGYPFTGKTWSALTWPNPVVANFDNKLGSHAGRDVIIVPFNDPKFVDSLAKRTSSKHQPNVRDAFMYWLETEAFKLEREQTFILDSWTMLNNAQEYQQGTEIILTKTGNEDDRAPWRLKLEYFKRVCSALRSLNCDVIVTFHEQDERHKIGQMAGELTGKVRPLMSGQFKDQLAGHFTDFFRQHAIDKPLKPADLKLRGKQNEPWITDCYNSTPENVRTMYLWQTYSDDIADCGSTLNNPPPFIPANYESFKRYRI